MVQWWMFYVHTCKSVYCSQSWCNIPQRLQITVTTHKHTQGWNAHFHTDNFATILYISLCLILWCTCTVLLRDRVGWAPLDLWVITDEAPAPLSFSLLPPCVFEEWQSVTFLIWLKLPRGGGKTHRLLGLITSTFLAILCAVIWILTLSCWDDTCVQFLLTHMYIKCINVYTCAIHKQSITVTNIANSFFFQLLF